MRIYRHISERYAEDIGESNKTYACNQTDLPRPSTFDEELDGISHWQAFEIKT